MSEGMMGLLGLVLLDYWADVLGLLKMGMAVVHSERRTLM